MIYLRLLLSKHYWAHYFRFGYLISSLLATYGTLFTIVKLVGLFNKNLDSWLSDKYLYFIVVGILLAYVQTVPRLVIRKKLNGRDVTIEVVVRDFFKIHGDRVIGSNTTFDIEVPGIISEKSIQGQFQKRFYSSESHLESDLVKSLSGRTTTNTPKKIGKTALYDVGTVAKLKAGGSTNYFLALATINDNAVANASVEDLKTALPKLWYFVSTNGTIEPLVCPILGSGFSRLSLTREEIVLEIISSFIASCSDRKYTEKLTIAVLPNDFLKYEIDFPRISAYLEHVTRYASFNHGSSAPVGTGLS